jgi:enamine deaminase RidA (YjgF/YER057c/UK114 family)
MHLEMINPEALGAPRGYSNGVLAPVGGRMLFVSGQISWNSDQEIVGEAFVVQFSQALKNVLAVVEAAGGTATDLASMTIYVTDKKAYIGEIKGVGAAYRTLMGRHFPAMALVEVNGLLEPRAQVEIQAIAVLPPNK